tara:strand:- start:1739 stop:2455 length:717 start_codon:yes stop_codon:yes gene_type:complete
MMALPRLNDVPYYELTVPSTKKIVRFRPFLIKEQKVLLIAYESRDVKQIMNTVLDCISSCVENIDVLKLSTFDVDYIFTQIRSKAVGEKVDINMACKNCDAVNKLNVDLSTINIDVPERDMHIVLNDTYTLKMKYPTYPDIINDKVILNENRTATEQLLGTLRNCMEAIQTENENILLKDETVEEIDDFINSLNEEQYTKIADFVGSMPTLRHEQKYNCQSCEKEQTLVVEGLQDFFT